MSRAPQFALTLVLGCLGCSDVAPAGAPVAAAGTTPSAQAGGAGLAGGGGGQQPGGMGGGAGAEPTPVAGAAGSGGAGGDGAGSGGGGTGPLLPADGPASSRQTARPLGSTQATQGFYEYLPPGYGDGTPRPLLLFFHGGGERGDGTSELSKLLVHGPPWLISKDEWPTERPFVVLSPQHSSALGGCPEADEVQAFLTFALASYVVDPRRVYLTGLSCGGHAIWRYLGKYGGQSIAAGVPICGDGRSAWTMGGCAMADAALWAFHGAIDPTVLPVGTTETVGHLLECPMPPRKEVKMEIFPGVQHESWPPVYDLSAGHDIYAWMLGHATALP